MMRKDGERPERREHRDEHPERREHRGERPERREPHEGRDERPEHERPEQRDGRMFPGQNDHRRRMDLWGRPNGRPEGPMRPMGGDEWKGEDVEHAGDLINLEVNAFSKARDSEGVRGERGTGKGRWGDDREMKGEDVDREGDVDGVQIKMEIKNKDFEGYRAIGREGRKMPPPPPPAQRGPRDGRPMPPPPPGFVVRLTPRRSTVRPLNVVLRLSRRSNVGQDPLQPAKTDGV